MYLKDMPLRMPYLPRLAVLQIKDSKDGVYRNCSRVFVVEFA